MITRTGGPHEELLNEGDRDGVARDKRRQRGEELYALERDLQSDM